MLHLTPSRIVVVFITISLISFFWTFGVPHQLAELSTPIIQHPADEAKLHDPIAPAPVVKSTLATSPSIVPKPTSHGDHPKQGDDHRWDDKTSKAGQVEEQTPLYGPTVTAVAGHGDDGGRWSDKKKPTKSASGVASGAASAPTTLLIETSPAPDAKKASTTTAARSSSSAPALHSAAPVLGFCKDVHNAADVMVIVRTSKADIFDTLSAHLRGLFSCVPNFAIFSDHAGEIDGIPVYDALRDISSETQQHHDEFREYNTIKSDPEYKPDAKKTKDLDKWKMLPMVYQAYQMNPHARFYAFIEADTGLSWTNLLQWVARLDYRIPYYSGAQSFINHVQFAQRGPGILLSQGALRRYAKSYEERWASEWEKRIGKECCGDYVLATALNEAHVELYTSWPLIQGEQPNTLDYSSKQWCAPAVSWHGMDNDALDKSWDLQKAWTKKHGWEKPYLYRDAFEENVRPHIKAQVEYWDNLGSDTKIIAEKGRQKEIKAGNKRMVAGELEEAVSLSLHRRAWFTDGKTDRKKGVMKDEKNDGKKDNKKGGKAKDNKKDDETPEEDPKETIDWKLIGTMVKDGADDPATCKKVCLEIEDCLQWRYTTHGDGECHLSKAIRLGKAVEKKEGVQQWTSGWMVDRITEVTKEWECKEVHWRFYQ